jgi:hypothetical protein
MKLTFFLIAVGLILVRLCFPQMDMWHNGREQGTMITKSDNYIEGIWWSGKVRLSDDEQSIAEISPGGHLKFRENDTMMRVESDLQGRISYTLKSGNEDLPLNDSGRRFIARQIRKMIGLGFFGQERADRIYRQGGVTALLSELSQIKMEGARDPYLNLLFKSDSLTPSQRIQLLRTIDNSDNPSEKQDFLKRFTPDQLRDSAVVQEWLNVLGQIGPSYMKKDLLLSYIDTGLTADRFDTVLAITMRFESPNDQQEVYERLAGLPPIQVHDSAFAQPWLSAVGQIGPSYIKKGLLLNYLRPDSSRANPLPGGQFSSVLAITGRFESPEDQKEILDRLIELPPTNDVEWIGLIRATGALQPDYLKTELLLKMAPGMPRTDSLRGAYRLSAKSIQGDMDFGKVMRAID